MAKLYEISYEIQRLLDLIEIGELGIEDIADTLESLEFDLAEKIEKCCYALRNMEAEFEACKKEEERFKERKQRIANQIERFKGYILTSMQKAEMSKIDAGLFKVSRRTSGGKQPVRVLVDPRELPEEFQTITTTYTPNKEAILEWLEAGNVSDQFYLGERSQYVSIK